MKQFIIILIMLSMTVVTNAQKFKFSPDMGKEYSVKVIDDHAVLLISKSDTITLLLENATNLAEERVIYVKSQGKSTAVKTEKTFTDTKGVVYPVWKSGTGKYFYWKTSAKTDKPYKVYLSQM